MSESGATLSSRIMLVRHGRSAHVLRERWIDAAGVHRWRDDYDAAGIHDASTPPPTLLSDAARADLVIASDLARAVASAARLAAGREVRIQPLLREYALDIPTWLPARWPLTMWAVAIHVQWLTRAARGISVAPGERQRVGAAADWLEDVMRQHRHVVVVTHGVFRGLLGAELTTRGWTPARRISGYRHWSVWNYVRGHPNASL